MLISWYPVVVLVLGLLLWALSSKPVPIEAGRLMFFAGLLVTLLVLARTTVRLG